MSSYTKNAINTSGGLALLGGLLVLLAPGMVMAQAGAGAEADGRSSISTHTIKGGRDKPELVVQTTEDFGPLLTTGERSKLGTRSGSGKLGAGSAESESASYDFWFYDVDVVLFNDDDRDGYFYSIDLMFDVDTNFAAADIYAVMYLSFEGGPWNEYAATEDFTIFGASGTDEYVVVTELMSGYPTGSYDLLIEVFDAYDGTFLTSFGPADTSELAYLPLEDYNRDAPPVVVEQRTTVSRGGGGAADGWLIVGFLVVLIGGGIRRIWRRRHDRLVRIDSPAPAWRSAVNSDR